MKFYISADIEGVSGVVNRTHTSQTGQDYVRARRLMTGEVNAAIEALIEGGATEVVVNDSHGQKTNILLEELNSKAQLITGSPKKLGMMEGIDETYDGALLIGYHSRMHTAGVLSHSYHSGVISNIKVNGVDAGECFINSAVAGFFNVPVIMASGDDILCQEAKAINSDIEVATVKIASGRYAAKCLPPEGAHDEIKKTIKRAVDKMSVIQPFKVDGATELEIAFLNSGMAETVAVMPGTNYPGGSVVKYQAKDILEAYRALMTMIFIANNTI